MKLNEYKQLIINLITIGILIYLWYGIILSIPNNGIIYFDFNSIGEIWIELIIIPIIIIFIIKYIFEKH